MKIATQQNGNVYLVTYFAQESKYNDYFPTVQKMLDSFNILKTLQYESFTLGMRMNYFSSWNTSGENSSYAPVTFQRGYTTTFFPSKENNSNGFKEHFEIFVSEPYQHTFFAQQSFNQTIEYYKVIDQYLDLPNFKLIESNSSNTENIQPLYNITYSYGDPDFGIINTMHIITIQNHKLYSISYTAQQEEYEKHSRIINKMMKSIEFFNLIRYPDPNLGVILEYPSDWKRLNADNKTISFYSQFLDRDYPFRDPVFKLKVYGKEHQSIPLYNEIIYSKPLGKVNKTTTYVHTTLDTPVAADKIVARYIDNVGNIIQVMQVNALFKNNVYNITYIAESDEYKQSLSTVEKIIESVKNN